jgi:hypothetical protein
VARLWDAAIESPDLESARALALAGLGGVGLLAHAEGHFFSLIWCSGSEEGEISAIPKPVALAVALADLMDLLSTGTLGPGFSSKKEIRQFLLQRAPRQFLPALDNFWPPPVAP